MNVRTFRETRASGTTQSTNKITLRLVSGHINLLVITHHKTPSGENLTSLIVSLVAANVKRRKHSIETIAARSRDEQFTLTVGKVRQKVLNKTFVIFPLDIVTDLYEQDMVCRTLTTLHIQNRIELFGIYRDHHYLLCYHHTTYIGTVKGSALEISS
jgi:hypothetical protein